MSSPDSIAEWLVDRGPDVRRKVRLLMLLDAADYAAITPISTGKLHGLAYLADVLSPIYGLSATRGKILKRRAGPYYPDLQAELDRLVGLGLADIHSMDISVEEERGYIDAEFFLIRERASLILEGVYLNEEFLRLREFFRALADALGAIDDSELDNATQSDLTWEGGASGALIDFAEWRAKNLSVPNADVLRERVEGGLGLPENSLGSSASLHLYVRYLKRSANG